MTGEITLTGQVLPIGGVKEKVLGAKRAGIKKILLPKRNEIDLDDVPKEVRDTMAFVLVEELSEVFATRARQAGHHARPARRERAEAREQRRRAAAAGEERAPGTQASDPQRRQRRAQAQLAAHTGTTPPPHR